jgi:flagellin
MGLNSVNTNIGAMVALQSLESTQTNLTVTEKQISTGFRVADSTDDGAAYAIAQGIRSSVGALTSANQQLGNATGLLTTTQSGLNNISNMMASMRDVLVKLSDSSVSGQSRTDYITQYTSMLSNVKTFVQDADYNSKTLIGNISGGALTTSHWSNIAIARNDSGSTYGVAKINGSTMYHAISFGTTTLASATSVAALITANGTFLTEQNFISTALNTIGSAINYVANQTTYNTTKINSLNSGLGSLIDADLAKESAQLTALQIRQQLGAQALSLANQAPQTLLSLFK